MEFRVRIVYTDMGMGRVPVACFLHVFFVYLTGSEFNFTIIITA